MHKLSILQYTGLRNPSFDVSTHISVFQVYCAMYSFVVSVYSSISQYHCASPYSVEAPMTPTLQYSEEVSELQELEGLLSRGTRPHVGVRFHSVGVAREFESSLFERAGVGDELT